MSTDVTTEPFVVLTHGPVTESTTYLSATLTADTVHAESVNLTVYYDGRPDTWTVPLTMFTDALAGRRSCHVQYHAWPATGGYLGVALPGRGGDRCYWLPRRDVDARVAAIADARIARLESVLAGGVR
jgi:hypothetical protein